MSDTPDPGRAPGTRPSDKTLVIGAQDVLLEQLKKDLVDDYDVESELGRGGMAVVYRAVERELHRTVALKVLPPGMGGAQMAERFRREARMAAALDHQNIIPVYRVGQAAGTFFFAMKFVEGRAVDAIVEQQGALPVPVVLQVLRSSTSALAFAHERGIVHRDIKGANILIDRDGRVLVSDFGIARAQEEKTLTASGSVIGTPHFMSPEQCSGEKVGPQSDQYSLGILAFQMLTGSVPFDADSLMAILHHHFFTPVPDITQVREGVPEGLIAVVQRSLSKEPGGRYESTKDMLAAIEAVPFTDTDRRDAEEQLRQLAIGTPVPKVRTGSLPPLASNRRGMTAADTSAKTVTAPAPGVKPRGPAAKPAPRKSKKGIVAVAVLVVAGGGGVAAWQMQRVASRREATQAAALQATRDSVARDSAAAVARQLAADTANARLRADSAKASQPVARDSRPQRPSPAPPAAPVAQSAGEPGLLRVSTFPPSAEILVDGRVIGQGGVVDEPVPVGRHVITIRASGFQTQTRTVNIASGQLTSLGRITLEPNP